MKLNQAIQAFSDTTVDGWDQALGTWTADIAKGSILTFDRFITERAFGQKKRIFQMAGEVGIPANYEAIRDVEGIRYLLGYLNTDAVFNTRYNNVYLIQRADADAELLSLVSQTASSGAPTGSTPTVIHTFPADFDRVSNVRSSDYDPVTYTGYTATIPLSIPATTDHELRVDGIVYDILEVYESVGLKGLRISKRSAGA